MPATRTMCLGGLMLLCLSGAPTGYAGDSDILVDDAIVLGEVPTPSHGALTATAIGPRLPVEELERLVAPVALYPDVLLAQVLAAATYPTDVVQAARWLRTNPDMSTLVQQPWDPSVLALCNYPEVLYKLAADLDWTAALGAAYLNQPQNVMEAVQRLRVRARDTGVLESTPQQSVVVDEGYVRIVPAEREYIYVPSYDPQVIYTDLGGYYGDYVYVTPPVTYGVWFGRCYRLGAWLDLDCDWDHRYVAYCRPGYWRGWRYCGTVAWGDDWAAAVGRRRGAIIGPHGGAVWDRHGRGVAWHRDPGRPTPYYSGRYAGYNRPGGGRPGGSDRRSGAPADWGNRGNWATPRTGHGGDRVTGGRGDPGRIGTPPRLDPGIGSTPRTGFGERPRSAFGDPRRPGGRGVNDQPRIGRPAVPQPSMPQAGTGARAPAATPRIGSRPAWPSPRDGGAPGAQPSLRGPSTRGYPQWPGAGRAPAATGSREAGPAIRGPVDRSVTPPARSPAIQSTPRPRTGSPTPRSDPSIGGRPQTSGGRPSATFRAPPAGAGRFGGSRGGIFAPRPGGGSIGGARSGMIGSRSAGSPLGSRFGAGMAGPRASGERGSGVTMRR